MSKNKKLSAQELQEMNAAIELLNSQISIGEGEELLPFDDLLIGINDRKQAVRSIVYSLYSNKKISKAIYDVINITLDDVFRLIQFNRRITVDLMNLMDEVEA